MPQLHAVIHVGRVVEAVLWVACGNDDRIAVRRPRRPPQRGQFWNLNGRGWVTALIDFTQEIGRVDAPQPVTLLPWMFDRV